MSASAQLQAFRKLIRLAARVFFLGDVTDVTREDPEVEVTKSRAKKIQIDQRDLVVVVIDALSYREWVSVDKFAEQIHMSAKQVRKVLHYLETQGFVVREHRREKRKGNKVESVDDPYATVEKGQTSSYVSIDYPHFFDMLRLRMYLSQKALDDKIDDRAAVKKYVCGPDSEQRPGCGAKYTSFTIVGLPITEKGLLRCNVCDFGIVEPVIAGKSAASWRMDRDVARAQRKELKGVFQELEAMIEKLRGVVPPDFGTFTDWVQARAERARAGGATGGGGRAGGGRGGGALDYGIDGPLSGDAAIKIALGEGAQAGDTVVKQQKADPRSNLPYFMQQDHATGTSLQATAATTPGKAAVAAAAAESATAAAAQDEEQRAVYEAYVAQYMAQVAAIQGQQGKTEPEDDKDWMVPTAAVAQPLAAAAGAAGGSPGLEPAAKRVKLEIGVEPDLLATSVPPPSPGAALFVPPVTPVEAPAEDEGGGFEWEGEPAAVDKVPTPAEADAAADAYDWDDA